jgi:hypothetical protein
MPRTDVHDHGTRQRLLLDIPRVRLRRTQNSHTIIARKIFIRISAAVKRLDLKKFSSELEGLMRENAFHSLEEFFEAPLDGLT